MADPSSIMDHGRNENGEISGGTATSRAHGEEVQAGCRHREWQDLGHLDGVLWSSGLNLDQSFQTPHLGVFAGSKGSYLREHRRRSWEAKKDLIMGY